MFTIKIVDATGAALYAAEQVRMVSPSHTADPVALSRELDKYTGCAAIVRGFTPAKGWVDYPVWPDSCVYVMNANRKTVDRYEPKGTAL